MIGIYSITNPINRVYIGQSIDIEKRFNGYNRLHAKSQVKLNRSFIKYGVENHKFEIITECQVEELNYLERYYQELYNVVAMGLNCMLTNTCDRSGSHSEETKLKMSESSKNMSDETRKKIGLASKGNKYALGKKHSEETKIKMSKSRIGNKHNLGNKASKETKLKMSESGKGNKNALGHSHSYETKSKISEAGKGRKQSDETKQKISESLKNNYYKNISKK